MMKRTMTKLVKLVAVAAVTWGMGVQMNVASAATSPTVKSVAAGTAVAQKASSLSAVKSYTIYYGGASDKAIKALSQYQMVIIEPRNWTTAQLALLKKNGVKVLGYLSVLEQNSASSLLTQAQNADYLLINGKRDPRAEWSAWSMNINSGHYRDLLFADTQKEIVNKGLDGVFLDTMGDADDGIWSTSISDSQRDGSVKFVADLRSKYPNMAIMQNWGLQQLKDRTAPYIDGILWEDFTPKTVVKNAWSKTRMQELDKLHVTGGLSVFTSHVGLSGAKKTEFDQLNAQHGYVGDVIRKSYDVI
ncbi:MAG: endo alpha-1,4 polygalactosaminidase [Tumebacillaceae bacterium]